MKRNSFFGVGVVVLVLLLGLVLVQQASSLDKNGMFSSEGERDAWVQKVMTTFPFYMYDLRVNEALKGYAKLLPYDENWMPTEDDPEKACLIVIYKSSKRGAGTMAIHFYKTEEAANKAMGTNTAYVGPFDSGRTTATIRAANVRILTSQADYRAAESSGAARNLLK